MHGCKVFMEGGERSFVMVGSIQNVRSNGFIPPEICNRGRYRVEEKPWRKPGIISSRKHEAILKVSYRSFPFLIFRDAIIENSALQTTTNTVNIFLRHKIS
jgi:hypothetical protein